MQNRMDEHMTEETQSVPHFPKLNPQRSWLHRIEYVTPPGELDLSPLSLYSVCITLTSSGPFFITYLLPYEPDIDDLLFSWGNALLAPQSALGRITVLRPDMSPYKIYEVTGMMPIDFGEITYDWRESGNVTRRVKFDYQHMARIDF